MGDVFPLQPRLLHAQADVRSRDVGLVLIAIALRDRGRSIFVAASMPSTRVQDQTGKIYPVFWIGVGADHRLPLLVFLVWACRCPSRYPALKGFNFKGGLVIRARVRRADWLALAIYTAAFIAEIVRAGIQAISHGQTEAAYALGLRPGRTCAWLSSRRRCA